MKISYRTHPPLQMLKPNAPHEFRIHPDISYAAEELSGAIKKHIKSFAKGVKVFSKPFADAALQATSKIIGSDLLLEYENNLESSGTIIVAHYTIFYIMYPNLKLYFLFAGDCFMAFRARQQDKDLYYADREFEIEGNGAEFTTAYWETVVLALLFFIDHSEVQIKHIPAKSKKVEIACKYVNDTDFNYAVYNSSWFTTLVKSDAFKVRGHFRLQPYGEGRKDRKLIWINEFEKSGYTAPARKLNQLE